MLSLYMLRRVDVSPVLLYVHLCRFCKVNLFIQQNTAISIFEAKFLSLFLLCGSCGDGRLLLLLLSLEWYAGLWSIWNPLEDEA